LRRLVDFTKLRWRIERDYQELKQEVGLGHFDPTLTPSKINSFDIK
jgi:SRSO17 transposase